jgi:hypothetical protein
MGTGLAETETWKQAHRRKKMGTRLTRAGTCRKRRVNWNRDRKMGTDRIRREGRWE